MINAYNKFKQLVDDTNNVDAIYQYIQRIVAPLDTTDLLRWQWVQTVSALDKLIHDLVKVGMLEEFNGTRVKTKQYENFQIDMSTYSDMQSNPIDAMLFFEKRVILCNGYKSFQDPKKIAEALSFIWIESDKWGIIANSIGMNKNDCITKLNNIVIRRNQIAHEGDYTDLQSKRQEIYESDVNDVKMFILQLGEAIYNSVR